MMIGAYAAWHLTDITHLPYPVSVVLAVLIAGLAGFLSDRALFQFTRNNLVNGLLVSIGLISVIESGALLLYTATPKNMDFVLTGSWTVGRHHDLAHEGRDVRGAPRSHRLDLAGACQHVAGPRNARLCAEPGSRHAHGREDRDAAGRSQRLLVCARRHGRRTLCGPLLPRAFDGRLVHPEGCRGRHSGGRGQSRRRPRRRHHSGSDRIRSAPFSCQPHFATPTGWSFWWPSCCSGRADCSGARNERRLAAAAALSHSGREPQRSPAHDPHLHLHPRHPRHRLQHRIRLCGPADDVPRRRLRDRRLRHISDPHQARRLVLAGAAPDVCRDPDSFDAGGMDLLQVQAARVLFCGRHAGLLRARPARRAELEQRHERDLGPSRARQAHRVAAGRRRREDRRHASVVSAHADLACAW